MGNVIKTEITQKDEALLLECVNIAHEAKLNSNHPFGALLADKNGEILLKQGNDFTHGGSAFHAETLLVMKAVQLYPPQFLSECTLYTNFEPCVMCSGAIYWANIGRLCYGVSEASLLKLTGSNDENPTFSLSAEKVFESGQKTIEIAGPLADNSPLVPIIIKDHIGFWK
ncbi:MAG: nucleoside deaminase [Spirochaetales bacterium]|nr:nucleoside deaminase [Spirochaetales bacterium]